MSPVWGAETSSEPERKEEREKRQGENRRIDRLNQGRNGRSI